MLTTTRYASQKHAWPKAGRHILAQYDSETIVVYQAYQPAIADWAVQHGQLGGPHFSYSRMSWIKPNFLWMMYRSGWGTKDSQERTLGLRIKREFFDLILSEAVQSSYYPGVFESREAWSAAVSSSQVRLQWDPDHGPRGEPLERKAIQPGLRGARLRELGQTALVQVHDLSTFVEEQRKKLSSGSLDELDTPVEQVYVPASPTTVTRLGLHAHIA